jgi:hypothetical protein
MARKPLKMPKRELVVPPQAAAFANGESTISRHEDIKISKYDNAKISADDAEQRIPLYCKVPHDVYEALQRALADGRAKRNGRTKAQQYVEKALRAELRRDGFLVS